MVSATATTLASNRRKFRLAQHHSHSSSGAAQTKAQALDVPTAATSTLSVVGPSSVIASSKTCLTSGTTTLPGGSVTRPQHFQQQPQQPPSYSQAPVPPCTSKGGAPSTSTSAGSNKNNNSNSTATTRGRSRRSRAATRRGVGGAGRGGEEAADSREEHDHEDIFSSLSSIDIASQIEESITVEDRQRIHRTSPAQLRVDEHDHTGQPLNLHVVESVDSDDSGTCFNSIGTTTPRQPSPRYVVAAADGANHHSTSNDNPHLENIHADFSTKQRQPDPDQPDLNINSRLRLLPSTTKNRWRNRSTSNADNMHLNSSDTLSPLHEHISAAADSSAPSSPSSFRRHVGNAPQEQDEFGSKQSSPNWNSKNSSIWDRPEEMVSSHIKNSRGLDDDGKKNTIRSLCKPSDNGSASSEVDWDGISSHRVEGTRGGGGWDNYNAQHASRQGPPSAQGSASVEYSRYDAEHDIQTYSASGARGVEPFQRDSTLYKRSVRQPHGTLSNNGVAIESVNDNSNTDDAIFNQTNMKATFGVCAAATLGGKRI